MCGAIDVLCLTLVVSAIVTGSGGGAVEVQGERRVVFGVAGKRDRDRGFAGLFGGDECDRRGQCGLGREGVFARAGGYPEDLGTFA